MGSPILGNYQINMLQRDWCPWRENPGLGFRVWGLGFRVWGLGFRVTLNPKTYAVVVFDIGLGEASEVQVLGHGVMCFTVFKAGLDKGVI